MRRSEKVCLAGLIEFELRINWSSGINFISRTSLILSPPIFRLMGRLPDEKIEALSLFFRLFLR